MIVISLIINIVPDGVGSSVDIVVVIQVNFASVILLS